MNGLKYLNELRVSNHRIRELANEIQTFENNQLHLEILIEEQNLAKSAYEELVQRWESQYLPAIETRQNLRNELYLAKTQPETYRKILYDELKDLSVEQINQRIAELQANHSWKTLSGCSQSSASTSSTVSTSVVEHDSQISDIQPKKAEIKQRDITVWKEDIKHKDLRQHHARFSWSLSSASSKLVELIQTKSDIAAKKRSLGSRTCELTAKLKTLQEQTESLSMAMRLPPSSFYSSIEHELRPLKTQIFEDYLKNRSTKDYSPGKVCLTSPECSQHTRSESNNTKESTPSWRISISTSMTDLSSLGNDFLKATEESINQITVNWM